MGDCVACGKPLVPAAYGPPKRYCNVVCRAAASRQRALVDGRAVQWQATSQERRRRQPDWVPCEHCGVEFERRNSNRRYCSPTCRNRAFAERRKLRPEYREVKSGYDRSRRVRKKTGEGTENIVPAEVFARDGWCCQLCRWPTDRSARVPNPWAPTLDHVLPLSRGGRHELGNVQTAHFLCNSKKSDRTNFDPGEVWHAWTSAQAAQPPLPARKKVHGGEAGESEPDEAAA